MHIRENEYSEYMKLQFTQYLIDMGYSVYTPSGKKSTAYDYPYRIDRVCEWEGMTWLELADNINVVIKQYGVHGLKENLGNKSNRAVINALKRFAEFLSI